MEDAGSDDEKHRVPFFLQDDLLENILDVIVVLLVELVIRPFVLHNFPLSQADFRHFQEILFSFVHIDG